MCAIRIEPSDQPPQLALGQVRADGTHINYTTTQTATHAALARDGAGAHGERPPQNRQAVGRAELSFQALSAKVAMTPIGAALDWEEKVM